MRNEASLSVGFRDACTGETFLGMDIRRRKTKNDVLLVLSSAYNRLIGGFYMFVWDFFLCKRFKRTVTKPSDDIWEVAEPGYHLSLYQTLLRLAKAKNESMR